MTYISTKPVAGYPRYLVDTEGNVYSMFKRTAHGWYKRPGRLKLVGSVINGYRQLELRNENGERKHIKEHHIVLNTFVGFRPEGMECCHNNGNRLDNRLKNLRWGTRKSNNQDRIRHGTSKGEKNAKSKLTDIEALEIKARMSQGENGVELAKEYGVAHSTIYRVKNNQSWTHV